MGDFTMAEEAADTPMTPELEAWVRSQRGKS